MFKKILLMIILTVAVMGCTAEDIALWKEAEQERREEGRTCYKTSSGYYYCVDDNGNRVY